MRYRNYLRRILCIVSIWAALTGNYLFCQSVSATPICADPTKPCPPTDGNPLPPHNDGYSVRAGVEITGKAVPYFIDNIGAVSSTPLGINCGKPLADQRLQDNCVAAFALGIRVTLFATMTSPDWQFIGWSGDCNGTQPSFTLPLRPPNLGQGDRGFTCVAAFEPKSGITFRADILATDYQNSGAVDTTARDWAFNYCGGLPVGHTRGGKHIPLVQLDGAPFEWTPVFGTEQDTQITGISGTALLPAFSGDDVWFTHPFGPDWEFFVAPDTPYELLLAPSNTVDFAQDQNAPQFLKPDGEYSRATQHGHDDLHITGTHGVLGIETDRGLIPESYRVSDGDRLAVFGRWIVDCGHSDFHTEIHPPLLIASAHGTEGGEATHSLVISRPYLVGQRMAGDNETVPMHMLNEVMKAAGLTEDHARQWIGATQACPNDLLGFIPYPEFTPCTTQIEAHPQILSKPFDGFQLLKFVLRPPTPRSDPGDRLTVRYHLTTRSGITAFVYGSGESPDFANVLVIMNSDQYTAPSLPRQNNGLGPNFGGALEGPDCSIHEVALNAAGKSDLSDYMSYLREGISGFLPPIGFLVNLIMDRGIATDCFDPPQPFSVTDSSTTTVPLSDVRGSAESIDNAQVFPIYGFIDVRWERHDATAPVVTAPQPLTVASTEAAGARWSDSPPLGAFLLGATATDNTDPSPRGLWPQISGADVLPTTLFPLGQTQVTFRAQDVAGNVGSAAATVTITLGSANLVGAIDATGRDQESVFARFRLFNRGTGNARNVRVERVTFRSVAGRGTVEFDPSRPSALPAVLGNVNVGNSTHQLQFSMRVARTVRQFAMTEEGTYQDVAGSRFSFSQRQVISVPPRLP